MENECKIYDVLYCYYENNKKTYKERSMWRYSEDDARIDCIKWCKENFGNLFLEIVKIKKI